MGHQSLNIDEMQLIDRQASRACKHIGFLEPLDRIAIRRGCLERMDGGVIAPERQHETLMFAAHHHATEEAVLLPEHRQGYVIGEAFVDTHALREQTSCPKSCEHNTSKRSPLPV